MHAIEFGTIIAYHLIELPFLVIGRFFTPTCAATAVVAAAAAGATILLVIFCSAGIRFVGVVISVLGGDTFLRAFSVDHF